MRAVCPDWVAQLTLQMLDLIIKLHLFQCMASLADQPRVFTIGISNLHLTIRLTILIPSNNFPKRNLVEG